MFRNNFVKFGENGAIHYKCELFLSRYFAFLVVLRKLDDVLLDFEEMFRSNCVKFGENEANFCKCDFFVQIVSLSSASLDNWMIFRFRRNV